ncbi:PREDICTED: ubiquitin-like protein-NEDD8-like protein RUB3 [Ipomoea nil]|uniref:ubiquitin-like protein-NEDD8-like protein RUB3 n=1 Tax=Ipomoea nil TaxID=35883 RepID=UPI000901CB40|nr:PREDICTED: ubiquitin-like protein-NEDD8-like protein RUB3 [Ipomoea nil]
MDLIFEPQRGTQFTIEIGYFDTVQEIKEKVQKYQGIPAATQTLIFNGNVLQDDLNVHSSEILDRSHVQLVVAASDSDTDKQQVAAAAAANKPGVSLEVEVTDTIRKMKERIEEADGIPVSRITVYANGTELLDDRTVHDYELSDHSEVDVSFKPLPPATAAATTTTSSGSSGNTNSSKKLRIMVVSQYGTKKFPVEVNPSENVRELRKELERLKDQWQLELPEDGYFFIYKQNVMDDDRSFRWHNVGQGDTIDIFNGSVTGGG